MTTGKSATSNGTLPRLARLFASTEKIEAITKALTALSGCFQQQVTLDPQTIVLYLEELEPFPPETLALAFSRAQAEQTKFFPSPGRLKELAGWRTGHRTSEQLAKEGLDWLIQAMRAHGRKLEPRKLIISPASEEHIPDPDRPGRFIRKFHPEVSEPIPCHVPEPVENALRRLGNGSREDGLLLLSQHPGFAKYTDEQYDNLGLRLSAMEKLEKRWLHAWEMGNREESVALEVVA